MQPDMYIVIAIGFMFLQALIECNTGQFRIKCMVLNSALWPMFILVMLAAVLSTVFPPLKRWFDKQAQNRRFREWIKEAQEQNKREAEALRKNRQHNPEQEEEEED